MADDNQNGMLDVESYNALAVRAFGGDEVAAADLIPEAILRGDAYDPDAIIAWVALRGPFDMTGDGEGEGTWNYELPLFLSTYNAFKAPEAVMTQVQALRTQKDLVEYSGLLDIPARAPDDVLESLGIERITGEPEDEGIGQMILTGAEDLATKSTATKVITGGLVAVGAVVVVKGLWNWIMGD
jgi:predicted Zn-dependent protease with MMP-like domain